MALTIIRQFTPTQVRAQILANLHRWERQGVWVSAFDEWREVANGDDDGELFAAMPGRNEKAVRLRQSAPYPGLLSPKGEHAITQQSVAALQGADELEAIKARGRAEWLKLRQANTQSRTRKPTRTRGLESRKGLERDSDESLDDDDSE
jgi:hypothetical protein